MLPKKIQQEIRKGRRLFSFMIVRGLGNVFAAIAPLLIAKALNPDILGSFFLVKMIIFFTISLFIAPLASPFNIESNKEYAETHKANKTFTSLLVYISFTSFLCLLIFLFWGEALISYTELDYQEYKSVFILAFLGLAASRFLPIFFLGQNKRKVHAWLDFIYPLTHLLYLIALYATDHLTLKNILFGYFIAGLVILFISIWQADYTQIFPISFSKDNFTELGRFASWMVLGVTTTYLLNWGDNIVLKHFVSLADVGVYNLAYQFFRAGLLFNIFVSHYYTPYLSQRIKDKKTIEQYLQVKRKKTFVYIGLGFLVGELATGPVIRFLFGPEYWGAVGVIRVLLLANVLMALISFYLPIFSIVKKYGMNNILLMFQLTLNLVLDIILVRYWGIMGAAIATTLAYIFYTVMVIVLFKKTIQPTLHGLWSPPSSL